MHSPPSRSTAFEPLNIDIYPWVRAGAAVTLIAACLIVVGTRMLEAPVLVTSVSESAGSMGANYVELRRRVEATLPALRVTNDPAEIFGREVAIRTAMEAAHSRAAQGGVFTQKITENVRAVITADLMRRSASDRTSLMTDVPVIAPRVNEPYPTGEALATFPPLLLQALPRLPDDLEYRFMGRHLIVRDAWTNLIVDYLPDVMTIGTGVTP